MGYDLDVSTYDKDGNYLGSVPGKNGSPLADCPEHTEYLVTPHIGGMYFHTVNDQLSKADMEYIDFINSIEEAIFSDNRVEYDRLIAATNTVEVNTSILKILPIESWPDYFSSNS